MTGTISASISFWTAPIPPPRSRRRSRDRSSAPVASICGGAFPPTSTSLPESTSALPPNSLIFAASDGLMTSVSTRSMIRIEASSVHAQALDEARGQVFLPHRRRDGLAAAVDDDRVDADRLEKDDVAHHALDQVGIFHRRAAVLHHDGAPAKLLEIGQRLEQRVRLGVSHHSPLLIRTYSSVRSVVRILYSPMPEWRWMVMVNFGWRTSLLNFSIGVLLGWPLTTAQQAVVINLHHLLAHARTAVAQRGHDPAPVRVAAGPRGLDQLRFRDGQRRQLRVLRAGRALDHDIDHAGDPLAVLDDHPRELAHDVGERLLEQANCGW